MKKIIYKKILKCSYSITYRTPYEGIISLRLVSKQLPKGIPKKGFPKTLENSQENTPDRAYF